MINEPIGSLVCRSGVKRNLFVGFRMKSATILTFLIFLVASLNAYSAETTFDLPSGQVDLVELTKKVSKITGFTFLYGKEFSGTVHLVAKHKVNSREAFEIYLSVLAEQGFTTIEKGRVIKIVRIGQDVDPNLIFLKGEPIGPSDRRITVFIDLSHISSAEAAMNLQSLAGKNGKILASPVGNRLIVVDEAAKVEQIRNIVSEMDKQGAKVKVDVITLERASAVRVAEILKRLFRSVGRARASDFGKRFVVLPDLRTNSVVIQAPDNEVRIAKKLLKKIDNPSYPNAVSLEYLSHAGAQELSELLKTLE